MSLFGNIGNSIAGKVQSLFGQGAEDDDAPVLVDDIEDEVRRDNPVKGFGYNISFCHYHDLGAHAKPYFFTSPLGAPFPSYHSNPSPDFPARWTLIDGVKIPCESLTAPRIRLSPVELKHMQRTLARMRDAASKERQTPKPTVINLAHQTLGDPYQYEAFVTFWDINKGAHTLNLTDNELDDITDLDLSSVRKLYLSRNNFSSFWMLPDLPNCEELYLNDNFITGVRGLSKNRFPRLRKLALVNNPLEELDKYKSKVISELPELEWLNDEPVAGWDSIEVPRRWVELEPREDS